MLSIVSTISFTIFDIVILNVSDNSSIFSSLRLLTVFSFDHVLHFSPPLSMFLFCASLCVQEQWRLQRIMCTFRKRHIPFFFQVTNMSRWHGDEVKLLNLQMI